jgi:hypothetical protein
MYSIQEYVPSPVVRGQLISDRALNKPPSEEDMDASKTLDLSSASADLQMEVEMPRKPNDTEQYPHGASFIFICIGLFLCVFCVGLVISKPHQFPCMAQLETR